MMMTMAAFCLPMAIKQNGGGQHSHFPSCVLLSLSFSFYFGSEKNHKNSNQNPAGKESVHKNLRAWKWGKNNQRIRLADA